MTDYFRFCGIKILFLTVAMLGISEVLAQEILTPSGNRTMQQNDVSVTGPISMDINYNVSWEASICDEESPRAAAWVTDYSVNNIEFYDTQINPSDVGLGILQSELEIIVLNSGIVAEYRNKDKGSWDQLGNSDDVISATGQRISVCSKGATKLYHYSISRNPHLIRISNVDNGSWKNRVSITENLYIKIALLAVEKRMSKAKKAQQRGDIDEAQRIALNAKNICHHTKGPNNHRKAFDSSDCMIKVTNFMKQLTDDSGNSSAASASSSQKSEQDQSDPSATEENSQSASGSIPQNSEQERARQQAIDEQANRSSNSDREREEWESDYQQRVQSMLDEMDRQSQIEAQIREQKREAMDAAVTKVAGMINQIQQQNRARKKRNRHRFIKNELSKEIEWQSRMFDKEADAYKNTVKKLKNVLDRYDQDIDKNNIDIIVSEMDEAIEKVKEIQQQKVSFLDQMERDFEAKFVQIKDRYYNTQPSREDVQSYIKVEKTSYSEISNSVGFSRFDLEYLLSQISIDYDNVKSTPENAIYEIAEIARDLDMNRPSVEEPSYGYYGYYTAYLPNGEKKLVDKIERNDSTPVELLALYGKYFPEGAHRAKIGDLIMKIAKDNKSVEVLEVYLKYYEDGPYAEKARELKPKFANWDRVQKKERLVEYYQRYKKTRDKALNQQMYGFLAAYVTSTGSVIYGLSLLTDPKNEISGGDETLAYTSFGVGIVSAVIGGILLRKSKRNEHRASDYKEKMRSLQYDLKISAIPNANHFDRTALLTLRFNF